MSTASLRRESSVSTAGSKADKAPRALTLEKLLTTQGSDLLKLCKSSRATSLLDDKIRVQIATEHGLDPKIPLTDLASRSDSRSLCSSQLQALESRNDSLLAEIQRLTSQQEKSTEVVSDALSRLQTDFARSQEETQEQLTRAQERAAQRHADLASLLSSSSPVSALSPGYGYETNPDQADMPPARCLVITGMRESDAEVKQYGDDGDDLGIRALHDDVTDVLQVAGNASFVKAIRIGRPSAQRLRPVKVMFRSEEDRLETLRCKSALSKSAEFRRISINPVLTPEQVAQKRELIPVMLQARAEGKRAAFRGYHLFINGRRFHPVPQVSFPLPTDPSAILNPVQPFHATQLPEPTNPSQYLQQQPPQPPSAPAVPFPQQYSLQPQQLMPTTFPLAPEPTWTHNSPAMRQPHFAQNQTLHLHTPFGQRPH